MTHRKLLNLSEKRTYVVLADVATAHSAHVFAKMRIADVLKIENSRISNELYRFALQSHFDFVITDADFGPQFAVEFDGIYHESDVQRSRDSKKNDLCERFGLPLLRVSDDFLNSTFGKTDTLAWLANTWFCWRDFKEQQSAGRIDFYEIFDPRFVRSFPGSQGEFPLWVSRRNQSWLRKQFFDQRIPDFGASHIVVKAPDGTFRAFAWIRTSRSGGAVSRASVQSQQFPVGIREMSEELALIGLKANAVQILDGSAAEVACDDILQEARELKLKNELRFGFIGGMLNPL